MPAININKGLKKDWSLNFKWESRQAKLPDDLENGEGSRFKYVLSDFSLTLSKKVGLNNSLAAGYLMRIEDNRFIQRATQQFTIVKGYSFFRLAHRFTTDQTFDPESPTEYRIRYRITPEFPLSGQSIDPKEFYFKFNNEYLNSFQGKSYDLELRFIPLLGYEFTDTSKLEFGLDYRVNSFLNNATNQHYWINLSWYLKI
ncbi:DUF2490 domain-containing protein [Adhaeribacter swui]|uniref:DUF2490 domain-containing protein n=1 Tax=Adhaeribacter swui TaxID=2086471 RepID=A0A7G7G9E6_9BACT|nr:DUF2490 domain-containing protein [Adhaeribacter swui]